MSLTYAYAADIVKSERDANGDLIVYGKATGPDLDMDGQICDPGWLRKAMPEWAEWGNVREMHQPIAAGVGMELTESGDDWMLKSKAIDAGTIAKLEAEALKGYSVGIRNAQVVKDATAPGGRIVGGTIVEISYVDRPCNPTAKLALAKAVGGSPDLQAVEAPAPKAPTADPSVEATLRKVAVVTVEQLRPLLADVAKGTPAEDIASAQTAIACIAQLISTEAESLASGEWCDAEQIRELLRAVRALQWFQDMERAELANAAMDVADTQLGGAVYSEEGLVAIDMGATPDTTKTAEPAPAAAATETPAAPAAAAPPAVETITKTALADLVKGAVAEATTPLKDRLQTVEADLAKALAQPTAGGPVLTRTAAQADTARATDSAQMSADAKALREKAAATTDPALRQGYLDRARDLTAKAAS